MPVETPSSTVLYKSRYSRQQQRGEDDDDYYYYDNIEYYGDADELRGSDQGDDNDRRDYYEDEFYPSASQLGNSKEEIELRKTSYYEGDETPLMADAGESNRNNELERFRRPNPIDSNYDTDYYYDDYDFGESDGEIDERPRPQSGIDRYYTNRPTQQSSEDDYFDDFDEEDEEPSTGNFWSNPVSGLDPLGPRRSGERDYARGGGRRRGQRRAGARLNRRSYQSGQSSPPVPIRDLYDRLFWYGFDASESDGDGDKTVFGGTKGKFSGLSFLRDGVDVVREEHNRTPRRRLPPTRQSQQDGYVYRKEDDDEYEKEPDTYSEKSAPGGYNGQEARQRRRGYRRENRYFGDDESSQSNDNRDWMPDLWPYPNDNGDYDEDYFDERNRNGGRRRRRKEAAEWSPFSMFDTFLGVDRERMRSQAAMYDEKMGLNRSNRSGRAGSRPRPSRQSSKQRRPGYAYRYDRHEEEEVEEDEWGDGHRSVEAYDVSAEPVETETREPKGEAKGTGSESRVRERTWEERALAADRVPPIVPAWGPSGDLGIDARTKAIQDALEDVQTAKLKVEAKEKKEALALEDLSTLKVEAERDRQFLSTRPRQGAPLAQERLRQIEFDIDDASLELRKARKKTKIAREQLQVLEDRHFALLNGFNVKQVGEQMSEVLKEFQDIEPAARLDAMVEPDAAESPDGAGQPSTSSQLFGSSNEIFPKNIKKDAASEGIASPTSVVDDDQS